MQPLIQSSNFDTARAIRFELIEKQYCYPKHLHQFAELGIVLSGELDITVDDKTEHLIPGNALLVFPFQAHRYTSNEINKLALFLFSPSIIPDFFYRTQEKIGVSATFRPKQTTYDIFSELISSNDPDIFGIKGGLYLILRDYLEQIELRDGTSSNGIATNVVKYIKENLTENISLDSIAAELGYNPNYLSGCISSIFGMNICTLIANIRTDKARCLLYETQKSIQEICYECGFRSERSFYRNFKEIIGKTPKQYRNDNAQGKIQRGILSYY